MSTPPLEHLTFEDQPQKDRRKEMAAWIRQWPIPDQELVLNTGLFLSPQTLSRVLFFDHLYRQILPVEGIVIEFGCRFGQTLSLWAALRGIYEPFNRNRKIVGFDTFSGLPEVTAQDGSMAKGMYGVPAGYEEWLARLLDFQEQESPLSHLKKYEIVRGDASEEIGRYLERNPQTVVALAYFDLDIYRPTRDCLSAIRKHLTQGSIVGFDELNDEACPGETVALREVLGISRFALRRFPACARPSYLVVSGPAI